MNCHSCGYVDIKDSSKNLFQIITFSSVCFDKDSEKFALIQQIYLRRYLFYLENHPLLQAISNYLIQLIFNLKIF